MSAGGEREKWESVNHFNDELNEAYCVPCYGAKERKELDKPLTEMEKENTEQ